jgi:hypothetical protein
MGDAERTNKTCTKLGPGVLGAGMETHSSLVAFLLLFSLLFFFSLSLFFKALLLKSLFKALLLKSSFLFFKVSFLRLALSHVFFSFSIA